MVRVHKCVESSSDSDSNSDSNHHDSNFSRLTAGRHNAHGYCKDVPQISRIVAHECTYVNGNKDKVDSSGQHYYID